MLSGNFAKVFALVCAFCFVIDGAQARPPQDGPERDNYETKSKCGYASCPQVKPNMLNVHLVAHTHDDVGWLKTVDQYYYGSETRIQKAGVQYIIDSVVDELLKDPNKRFIYVESAFFFQWWAEQTDNRKALVKGLVNEGRLEFIGGAWSMNDEATTHYQSVIDQFAWGLRLLNDTFGECGRPRIGWQIDPFGHSREMASMFAQMGYDGLFFGRLDYQDKDERLMTKKAEMIWRASANLESTVSDLFTGALYNEYQPPPGFCFDILCADEPIIDGKHSPDNNVKRRVDQFFEFVTKMSKGYRTKNILITMGEDFHYQMADSWYKNLDKLIKYGNERQANGSDINLLYSTPSCYLKALHDAGITWPTKDDDFFPYASDPHAYWTGYFTSRPSLKRYEREGNHFLQVCKQLTTLASQTAAEFEPHLTFLRETMGIMQHHDAITGTEKEKVAFDYAKRMSVGLRACASNTRSVLNQLTVGDSATQSKAEKKPVPTFDFRTCSALNISSCEVSEASERFTLTLYNPLAHATNEYVRVPVPDINYVVKDYRAKVLEIQFVPIPNEVQSLRHRNSSAKYELIFEATDLPAVGYKIYYIERASNDNMGPVPQPPRTSGLTTIRNDYLSLIFDTNGFLTSVTADGQSRIVSQEFLYYEGAVGNNREFRNRSSGAYIFRPKTNNVHAVSNKLTIQVYKGNLVEEVHQVFNNWISQVVRLYRHQRHAEFEWLVGPIPVEDDVGKEIITRFNSDIKSAGDFYTDSNGREMIKRKRDHRDTWNLKLQEETAGNYYPITTKIALQDDVARMALLTDRAQGGSSLGEGSLELMLHRRLLHDDAFGVNEALNETEFGKGLIARGKYLLFLGSSDSDKKPTQQALERFAQLEQLLPAWKFFSDAEEFTFEQWQTSFQNIYSGLSSALPKNVHLLTLEPWHENQLLIRFEHILEKDEDQENSKTVLFNLKDLLRNVKIADIRETTLDGNAWLDETRRLEFVPDPEGANADYGSYATFVKDAEEVYLLDASKPKLGVKYVDEPLPAGQLAAQSNRLIKRGLFGKQGELNRIRAERVREMSAGKVRTPEGKAFDPKFIIELSAMQIRTYVLFLAN